MLVRSILNETFFPGKIVTCLAYIFTMEKALLKIIFGSEILTGFQNCVALFMTFGMQKDNTNTKVCKKAVSKRWCKKSNFLKMTWCKSDERRLTCMYSFKGLGFRYGRSMNMFV